MLSLSLFGTLFSRTGKSKYSKENQKAANDSLVSLKKRMDILNQKALNLSEGYPEQRSQIAQCYDTLNKIEPSASTRAGKFEQQISVAITKVSTACDKIFARESSDNLDREIALLCRTIREREHADEVQEE
ncbi:MAG: hypothetical protein J6Y36_05340 [Treponema sp.]|uniref:hypothetical protein n=1 Tax=Treponema sp. TaxID=166 RepID=UPI001B66F175|nr:hypothetical protein [Treponema sp.]MBP5402565.1 hypothetical protein [Treponema sp.]MBR5933850.1 hypothetical protein [Treponema sp.]